MNLAKPLSLGILYVIIGGMNVTSLVEWNYACLVKLIWNLSDKNDLLWIKWVHSIYIKITLFEQFTPPKTYS